MIRSTNLKPEFRGYFGTSLADFYVSPAHRWLVYAVTFILSGAGSFGAIWIYDLSFGINLYNDIPLAFKGMYSWHTAINFAVCLLVVDHVMIYCFRSWGTHDRRTVGRTRLIFLMAFPVGFIFQRTLDYYLVDLYYPKWILQHETYPAERPGAIAMFLFMMPFWLIISYIVMRIILGMQARYEELLRVRIDAILEERAHQNERCPAAARGTQVVDDHIDLPLDSDVGPIG